MGPALPSPRTGPPSPPLPIKSGRPAPEAVPQWAGSRASGRAKKGRGAGTRVGRGRQEEPRDGPGAVGGKETSAPAPGDEGPSRVPSPATTVGGALGRARAGEGALDERRKREFPGPSLPFPEHVSDDPNTRLRPSSPGPDDSRLIEPRPDEGAARRLEILFFLTTQASSIFHRQRSNKTQNKCQRIRLVQTFTTKHT